MIYRRLRVFYVLAFVLMTQVPFIAQAANGFDPIDGSQLRSRLEQGMSCVFPLSVGTYDELKAAVNCFNTQTGDGSYTIELNSDILLTDYLPIIKNTNSNTLLVIEGNGYSLSGGGTLPSGGSISSETNVTVQNISFINGVQSASILVVEFPQIDDTGIITILNALFKGNTAGAINAPTGNLVILNSVFEENQSSLYGGAISSRATSLVISDSIFRNNQADSGGALWFGKGNNSLTRTSIYDNHAAGGGGISVGIFVTLTVIDSTISGNTDTYRSGGIYADSSNLTIVNSTISGNQTTSQNAGGISITGTASSTIINSTVVANTSTGEAQNASVFLRANLLMKNSIIYGTGLNCAGDITSGGYNVVSDSTCGTASTGDQFDTDPLVSPLADNGGTTLTHALLTASPAIDVGSNALIFGGIINDQRGTSFSRVVGTSVDAGAFEYQETLGFRLNKTQIMVSESGTTDTYTIVLNTEPTADVTVNLTSDAQVSTSPTSLTFTPADWNIPQTVTVTAVDDNMAENDHTSSVSHIVTSADALYNGITAASVAVNIGDNDGVSLVISANTLELTEGGDPATYTLVLGSQPTADVVVAPYALDEVSVSPVSVTFTPVDWNIPQTVTVSVMDDDNFEGPQTDIIMHNIQSADPTYAGLLTVAISVNITDNDQPTNLIANAGFEDFGEAPKQPAFWVGRGLTRYDRRLCNAQATFSGACGFQFKPDGNPMTASRELRQRNSSITLSNNHEVLVFSAHVRANNVSSGARVMIVVNYNDGSGRVDRLVVPIQSGTYGYTEISGTLDLQTHSIGSIVTRIRVGNRAGRLRIDDLFLALVPESTLRAERGDQPSGDELFTLPEAPDGFRGGN